MENRHKMNILSIEGYDHPLIEIEIGNKKMIMILDSGAITSCLNAEDSEGIEMKELYKVMYSGMEATRKTGSVVLTNVTLDGIDLQAVFVLADLKETFAQAEKDRGIKLNGMLGIDFFKLYECVLDFKENTIEFSDKKSEKYRMKETREFIEGIDGIDGLPWEKVEKIALEGLEEVEGKSINGIPIEILAEIAENAEKEYLEQEKQKRQKEKKEKEN